jgi:uncharacterized protein (TIGR03437 family)
LYSTYLGGSAPDAVFGIAVDAAGSAYATGGTQSSDFPVTAGAFETSYTGASGVPPNLYGNGFAVKFSKAGNLIYSTYLNGLNAAATSIGVDSQGQAYINLDAPLLASTPYVGPAYATYQSPPIRVLNASGSAIAMSSPVGGAQFVLDGKGGLYATGTTRSLVFFSTLHAFQPAYGGGDSDAFAMKVDFTQTALPALNSIVNAASLLEGNASVFPDGAVAPGELITLFGSGFGAQPSVSINTVPAPILYSSDSQINAVVPSTVLDPAVIVVNAGEQTIGIAKVPRADAVPAVFPAMLNEDGSVNSASNPAARGSVVSLWMTGAGYMNIYLPDGSVGPLGPPYAAPFLGVSAQIGVSQAPVLFAGQAPGLVVGVIQVNLQIPPNATIGSVVPLTVYVGNYVSPPQGVTIAIR